MNRPIILQFDEPFYKDCNEITAVKLDGPTRVRGKDEWRYRMRVVEEIGRPLYVGGGLSEQVSISNVHYYVPFDSHYICQYNKYRKGRRHYLNKLQCKTKTKHTTTLKSLKKPQMLSSWNYSDSIIFGQTN